MLEIKNLFINVEGKEIVRGINLIIKDGETHVIMGPNGSGKSTLAQTLMGHPKYEVASGDAVFNGESLFDMKPEERALEGLFMAFQYPSEVTGVTIANFLRLVYNKKITSRNEKLLSPVEFRKVLKVKMEEIGMDEGFMGRYLNEGFSGGEKKRSEILQMSLLEPKLAVLDETDSGLDVDALKIVSESVNRLKEKNKMSSLIITHYTRILKYIKPDFVHVMKDGKFVKEGGASLAEELEESGYNDLEEKHG